MRRLLDEWKRFALPVAGGRIMLAVSGGADSSALLVAFDELVKAGRIASEIVVAHFDHGLRGAAGVDDARWVRDLAHDLGREFVLGRSSKIESTGARRDNLEQAARRARYDFLAVTARKFGVDAVLTAHTMDDQAETVLLRLLRGSGAEGLGGMHPVRPLETGGDALLMRPLLSWARRSETEEFCRERGLEFRVDEMNEDERFARVRVRRSLLPLLETFNPRVVETIARTAGLLREDAGALEAEAATLLQAAKLLQAPRGETEEEGNSAVPTLRVDALAAAGLAVRRRALRQWIAAARGDLRRIELVHVAAVEKLLAGERGGRIAELPGGACVERRRGRLRFYDKKVEKA